MVRARGLPPRGRERGRAHHPGGLAGGQDRRLFDGARWVSGGLPGFSRRVLIVCVVLERSAL